MKKHLDSIYGKNHEIEEDDYCFSSPDNSKISNSDFGLNKNEDTII